MGVDVQPEGCLDVEGKESHRRDTNKERIMQQPRSLSREAEIQNRFALALLLHPEEVQAMAGEVPVPVVILPQRHRPEYAGEWMPMKDVVEVIIAHVRNSMIYEAWVADVVEEVRWCSQHWSPFWKEALRAHMLAEFEVDIADRESLASLADQAQEARDEAWTAMYGEEV